MVQINNINTQKFSLNGVEYFKNFTPIVVGNKITIVNTYDSKIVIVPLTGYQDFEIDTVTYGSVSLLQTALLPVIFTRSSLGVVGDFLSDDATTYTAATLPLTGTELALVNQGGTWKKVAVSEFGGGGASGLEVLFSDAATYSFTGAAANFVVHSFLIPANTLEIGDFIQMKAFVGRTTYANNIVPKLYVNTSNTLTGATLISSGLIISEESTIFQRDFFIRNTTITSMITTFNQIKSHYNTNSIFTESTINRASDLYFILALGVLDASDTGICNGFFVSKSK